MQSRIEIVYKNLNDIYPDPKNPRRNEMAVGPVMKSIEKFGFKVPIVISADGMIIAGHTRFKAAKNLGIDKVPCVLADGLDEKKLKAFQLADNKTAEIATWDTSMLNLELGDLGGIFDMTDFGFEFKQEKDSSVEGKEVTGAKTASDYVRCPRCGREFLKSEGHPKEEPPEEWFDEEEEEDGELF